MSETLKLEGVTRTTFGKGAARQLRRAGMTPGVIYGHGSEPKHVALPAHELSLILRKSNAVIEIVADGKSDLVLVKDVQRDPVLQIIEHVDLIIVKRGEKVEVEVPVHTEGETLGGTLMLLDLTHVSISADATAIPDHFTVNVQGLAAGEHIHAKDLVLPTGAELLTDPEAVVVSVNEQAKAAEAEEAPAAAPAAAATPAAE